MCAVVGYIGKSLCSAFIFEGLTRLEYRGYDAAGFACLDPVSQKLLHSKSSGQLAHLTAKIKNKPIDGYLGIGHTRWSTHGDIAEHNAHPHFDCSKTISVVHNGIIENYAEIKDVLQKSGHVFHSDTDTEVISHLCESITRDKSMSPGAVAAIVQQLDGAYAFIVMLQAFPDILLVVRKKSPVCIGIGEHEMFVASDVIALAGKTNKVLFLPDESFALVMCNCVEVYDFSGKQIVVDARIVSLLYAHTDRGAHKHFMLKEIYEQKNAIMATVESLRIGRSVLHDQLNLMHDICMLERICFIACGTSWHAACIARFFFESIVRIPVEVHLASEFRYTSFFLHKNILFIFITQSGETADTLEALRLVNAYGGLSTIALTNVATSTVVREARGYVLTQAGPEIAVASTKAFSTQLAALYWLAHYVAGEKKMIQPDIVLQAEVDLLCTAHVLENAIEQHKNSIDHLYAPRYAQHNKALFLGRHISYPLAMEAALKLKEVAYVFAESYPAGELKHGPLALVDNDMLIYIFSHQDPIIYQKLLSNAYEVKARGGTIIAFAYAGQDELCALAETALLIPDEIPMLLGPLAMIGLVQYFVYAIARERGCPIDKPRNLAKSVTVE